MVCLRFSETGALIVGIAAPALSMLPPKSGGNGVVPSNNSYTIAPNDQMSLALVGAGCSLKRSGPIYAKVPAEV